METRLINISKKEHAEKGIILDLYLDYLNNSFIGGNKWRKLKFNLKEARFLGKDMLISFGGAYSNHLYAFANACKWYGFKGIAIVRGDKMDEKNPTLNYLVQNDIEIQFVNRDEYRDKETLASKFLESYPNAFIIPEGGTNQLAVYGFEELVSEIVNLMNSYDVIVCPVGTGGTLAGISTYNTGGKTMGIKIVDDDSILEKIKKLGAPAAIEIIDDYTMGGYAKTTETLIEFINNFYNQFHIPLDPIYTGKMVYAIDDMIDKNFFKEGSKIVMIHTGGLQGILGYASKKRKYELLENLVAEAKLICAKAANDAGVLENLV